MEFKAGEMCGRYKVQRLVGRGGLGHVFLATDLEIGRNVAIKVGLPDREGDSFYSVLNEARILGALQHPTILNVFDVGQHRAGQPYMVREYLDAGTLRESLSQKGDLPPPEQMCGVISTVADALDYVHRRGYLHRNIKPSGILQDSSGAPRLSGFGVAVQQADLASAVTAGTPAYMAPEQIADQPERLGPPTDVWGLGATLYEALTGRRPFDAFPGHEFPQLIRTNEPAPPSSTNSSIPEELDRICLKCLSKNPRERYATAALLAADLRALQREMRPGLQHRVFVSHATKDRPFVEREIISHLETSGIRTWYSKVDIQTAAEWHRSILQGLESCEWVLIVLSPRSVLSEWVKDELYWAIDKRPTRIIPVLMEDCDFRDFHIRMARIQYLDFRAPSNESRARLVQLFERETAE